MVSPSGGPGYACRGRRMSRRGPRQRDAAMAAALMQAREKDARPLMTPAIWRTECELSRADPKR